jgi:hypothetical protein
VLLLAMKDMNIAKMTGPDLPLLLHMMSDLFPGVETMTLEYGEFKEAIVTELEENEYQATPWAIDKAIQLFETKNSRHSVMIVGRTGSGKSVSWRTLQRAMTRCAKKGVENFVAVKDPPSTQRRSVWPRSTASSTLPPTSGPMASSPPSCVPFAPTRSRTRSGLSLMAPSTRCGSSR